MAESNHCLYTYSKEAPTRNLVRKMAASNHCLYMYSKEALSRGPQCDPTWLAGQIAEALGSYELMHM